MGRFLMLGMAVLVFLSVACAAPPSPAPVSQPQTEPAPVRAAAPAPLPSAEDTAWEKVVQEAKKEGVLTIYAYAFVGDVGRAITREFAEKYGIRLEIMPGPSRQSLEKIKVEQRMKRPIADLLNSSLGSASELVIGGLATSVSSELPVLRDKSVFKVEPLVSPKGEIVSYSLDLMGILVNTKLVKPQDEPKALVDLLHPKWKGKMVSSDIQGLKPFYHELRFNKVLDLDYYRRLAKQDVAFWAGSAQEALAKVARGEYDVYVYMSAGSVSAMIGEGAPMKLLAAEEGSVANQYNLTPVVNSPHPNATRLFINWLLTKEGQTLTHQINRSTPLRKDVPDFVPEGARIQPTKIFRRTWESLEWSDADYNAGTIQQIFGVK